MEYCVIDLHAEYRQICILNEDGEVMETSRVRTSRKTLERFFNREPMRVVMEAGGSSPWVSRVLDSLSHEVVVCSPRRVRLIAESKLKNDRVDAEVLARLVRLDPEFLKPIQHRSEEAQVLRANLKVRSAMVEVRTKWINTVRGLLRGFGYKVSGKAPHTFAERVDQMELPPELRAVIEPLLEQLDLLSGEIARRNEHLEEMVKELPEVDHLREIPGVGPVVATYFVLTIDDPNRFKHSRDIASFFGLRPSMRESASVSHYGRITKEGDPEMRRLLVQAAHACLLTKADSELKSWALALAERKGRKKAVVALARKLAVLMHHLWVTGEVYQAFPNRETSQAA
ncbi:MAG: IS110 family transposase [Acidobacteriota bacterium]|nr:IS110 family transposase [Acidobacteriota bacterium]